MSKEARGKIAPEDSRFWKCKWLSCEHGCGLSGNGQCSAKGEWDNPDCPEYWEATCQHGIKVSLTCWRCIKANNQIGKELKMSSPTKEGG